MRARLDYALFGDFIHINTTYRTNAYNTPFASLIGINGHGKPTVFGWALLENDEADILLVIQDILGCDG